MRKHYDSIIVGAGPAGLSAAIYLARYNRSVLVIDKHEGRSTYPQINENYLGFPNGIAARELREIGKKQAEKFGAVFIEDEINEISGKQGNFILKGTETYHARTVILATGVIDLFPIFENALEYVGKSMFWCITCDGHKTIGKKVVIVGNSDEAAITCMQFLNYTKDLTMVTNVEETATNISSTVRKHLLHHAIPVIETKIINAEGKDGMMHKINLGNGKDLPVDLLFSEQGCNPNCSLATQLNVKLTNDGFIETDEYQRTTVEGVYAAGDVTRQFSHQVITAAHEGAVAAESANYDMYEPYQRHEK